MLTTSSVMMSNSVPMHIYAGFTEIDGVRPIITALMDKIRQNAQLYHSFRGILVYFEPDTDTALYYMPENGKI